IDLYELAGRAGVLTVMALFFSGLLWIMRQIAGEPRFIHMMVSAMAVLVLFDSIQARVTPFIARVFFRERTALDEHLTALRRRIAGALEVEDLAMILMEGLEESRRMTNAALYLAAGGGHSFELAAHLGPPPPRHIETATA